MQENLVFVGMLLILVGIVLIFLGAISSKGFKTDWGFFGLIGPIPFGAWSSKQAFILTLVILIILAVIIALMNWR